MSPDLGDTIEAAVVEEQGKSTPAPEAQGQSGTLESQVTDEAKATMGVQAEEPTFELKDEQGNLIKVKPADVLAWKKGAMLEKDYRVKTAELSKQRKEMQELAQFGEFLKNNPAKLQRVLEVLDEREDQVKEAITQQGGANPQDPLAQELKAIRAELTALKQYKEQTVQAERMEQARGVLNSGLDEVGKGLSFDGDEDKAVWRQMVLSHLKDNPKEYVDEQDFKDTLKDVGQKYYDMLNKFGEKAVKKYLESKKGAIAPAPTGVSGQKVLPEKPSWDSLEDITTKELEKSMNEQAPE